MNLQQSMDAEAPKDVASAVYKVSEKVMLSSTICMDAAISKFSGG